MKFNDKQSRFILWSAIAIVAFILIWFERKKYLASKQSAANTLEQTAGITGTPISPAFQYGQQSPFQINLGDYAAQIPQFHYDGNQTVYMPLFGFVGYGLNPMNGGGNGIATPSNTISTPSGNMLGPVMGL